MTSLKPLMRDQRKVDAEHLKLLAVFHFIVAGLCVLGIGFLLLHRAMLHTFLEDPSLWANQKQPPPPKAFFEMFRWFYVIFGAVFLIAAILNLISGLCLRRRKARLLSLIVAAFDVLQFPFGTTLAVFTFIVLLRESVVELYNAAAPEATDTPPPPPAQRSAA